MYCNNIDRNDKRHPLLDTLTLFSDSKDIDSYRKAMKVYCIALNNLYNKIMQDFRKDFHKLSARVIQHDIADKIKLPLVFLEEYSRAHINDDDIEFITRENDINNNVGNLVWDRVSSRLIFYNQCVIKNHTDFIRMIERSHIDISKLNLIYLRCDANKPSSDKIDDPEQWIKATMEVDSSYIKKIQDVCLDLFEDYMKLDSIDADPTLNESTMFNDIAENYLKRILVWRV